MKWHGREILLLRHRYNCQVNDPAYPARGGRIGKWLIEWHHRRHGVPTDGMRSSERAVEIPLAVDFLSNAVRGEPVLELGCVLPYYILKAKNHRVCDLMDGHPENERRDIRTLPDADLATNVVSISTLEHIGTSDYGIEAKGDAESVLVLKRILTQAKRCFLTFPLGHNAALDAFVLGQSDLGAVYLTRCPEDRERWMPVGKDALTPAMKAENTYLRANTICIIEKGVE